jgi:hypothetical protein
MIKQTPGRSHYPGYALGEKLDALWHSKTNLPLEYIAGTIWTAGNAAFYSPESSRPHVWVSGDLSISLWINSEKARKAGVVLVWEREEEELYAVPQSLANKFPKAQLQAPFSLTWSKNKTLKPLQFGWAWLPPQDSDKA